MLLLSCRPQTVLDLVKGEFTAFCLRLIGFYAVMKLMGTYLECRAYENSWFEAEVFERPSLTHKSLLVRWSDVLKCYMEQSGLLATWILGFMGTVSDHFVDKSCPEGISRNAHPWYRHMEG